MEATRMTEDFKRLIDFLRDIGAEHVAHTQKGYMGHLVSVYRLMQEQGCSEELCQAGMFHSIYGTQSFRTFGLPLERRGEVRALIGERAEQLAYLNCVIDRASLDRAVAEGSAPFRIVVRDSGEVVSLSAADLDDLCRVHLYDWLEQVPRSSYGWGYRREGYRNMAERLGGNALATYDRVFATEPAAAGT
jgi:hypothetical protein